MDDKVERLMPRFRFGAINPRSGGGLYRGLTYQFYRIVPTDVMEISTVLGLEDYTPEAVEKAIKNYWKCVDLLVRERVNVIVLGGAPISAQLGRPRVLDLLRETKERTSVPGDTPLEAVIAAMKHLGLTKLTIGSRWATELNDAIIRYLGGGGIKVVGITKRDQWAAQAAAMSFEEGLKTALDVGREAALSAPQAEAVFVPGGAAMSLHVIPAVEEEFGKPTFTNLSAEVWNNLVRPGIIPPVKGWGCLLAGNR
jgi:maleate cis-trans isomerase